ncbi:MAG: hypothetical protein ACRDYX_23055, partial [Egibacteraceae bacterium]
SPTSSSTPTPRAPSAPCAMRSPPTLVGRLATPETEVGEDEWDLVVFAPVGDLVAHPDHPAVVA